MCILPTSERVGKANKLVTKAKQLLEDYEGSIGLEERRTAEGLLAFTGDFQAGLEDKGIFGRHKQAQEYLERAQETHKMIEVQVAARLNAYWVTDFTLLSYSLATYLRSVLAVFGNFPLAPQPLLSPAGVHREITPAFVVSCQSK